MFRTFLTTTTIACSIALGIATGAFAQTDGEDGKVQTGKTKTTACIDHGGVRH